MDHYRKPGDPWTQDELAQLLTTYFGHKLTSFELERLIGDVGSALADQQRVRASRAHVLPTGERLVAPHTGACWAASRPA